MSQASKLTVAVTGEQTPYFPLTLSVPQAAKLLGVGESAVRSAVRRGDLPAVRIGKLIRVMRAPVLEMLGLPEDFEVPE